MTSASQGASSRSEHARIWGVRADLLLSSTPTGLCTVSSRVAHIPSVSAPFWKVPVPRSGDPLPVPWIVPSLPFPASLFLEPWLPSPQIPGGVCLFFLFYVPEDFLTFIFQSHPRVASCHASNPIFNVRELLPVNGILYTPHKCSDFCNTSEDSYNVSQFSSVSGIARFLPGGCMCTF